jgi:VanZ family protein
MSQPPASRTCETWRARIARLARTLNRVVRSASHVFDYLLFGLLATSIIATGYLQGAISMVDILPAMPGGGTVAPL